MKLLFITNVVNRPDFLVLQNFALKKFCKHNYHFCVVDDSIDESLSAEFQKISLENKISYFKKPFKNINNPADACAHTIQWTYDNIIQKLFSDYFIFYIDSDMFLIDYFEIDNQLFNEFLGGIKQIRENIIYPWNGLMFLNMKKINLLDSHLNFKNETINGIMTDVGGAVYYYLQKNNIDFFKFNTFYPEYFEDINLHNFDLFEGYNFELHYNKKFLHYRAGTNWQKNSYWKKVLHSSEKDRIFSYIKQKIISETKPIELFSGYKANNSGIDAKVSLLNKFKIFHKLKRYLKQII